MASRSRLVLIALVLALEMAGQAYRPFPTAGGAWVESYGWLQPAAECGYQYHTCANHIRMGPDTLVNDTAYITLWSHLECGVQQTNPPSVPPWCVDWEYAYPTHLYALLRQDIPGRKVFIRPVWEDQEHLLYDFNMGIGSYPEAFGAPSGQIEVVSIDSVLLADGHHKRWTLSTENWDGPVHVIEGVGSDAGFLTVFPNTFEGHNRLECFGANNVAIYVRWIDEGPWVCNLSVDAGELSIGANALRVHPNPANSNVQVEIGPPQGSATGMLIDARGQLVRTFRLIQGRNTIDVSTLSPGVYLLRSSNGRAARVVVQ